jgi:hypothetical protein
VIIFLLQCETYSGEPIDRALLHKIVEEQPSKNRYYICRWVESRKNAAELEKMRQAETA